GDQLLDVVHPGVVRSHVAAAHQHEARVATGEATQQAWHGGGDVLRRELDPSGRRLEDLVEPRLERSHVDPVRTAPERIEGEALWIAAVGFAPTGPRAG